MANNRTILAGGYGSWILLVVASAAICCGQIADGNLGGVVLDGTGAAIANATVSVESISTGYKVASATDHIGAYTFSNLPVGTYKVTASALGFQTTSLASVPVELNKTSNAPVTLMVGAQTDTITVTDTPSLVDVTTAQIANLYTSRMSSDLAISSNLSGGYLNLSLLGAGVASSGGVGAGSGPAVGGQRPRNNNYTIEGVDNNRKDVTGSLVQLPNDAVEEFSVLQNQFSGEFGHSAGGQFNAVIKGGTNEIHGRIYEYFQNRYLNAQDASIKLLGVSDRLRYDQNIIGGNIGGPILRDKLFYFGSFDYNPIGRTSPAGQPRYAPTADGYAALESNPALSQTNLGTLKQYLGVAPLQDGNYTVGVQGAAIPAGIVPIISSSYTNGIRGLGSLQYNMSERDQWRGRFIQNRVSGIDTAAQLPAFWTQRPVTAYLASLSEFHTFSPTKLNEVRLAYNRFNDRRTAPGFNFPGLDSFPTIGILDLNLLVGPWENGPQATTQNTYQVVDNFSWNFNRHDLKFGFDGRDAISSIDFVQRLRGDYRYTTLDRYLMDLAPDRTSLSGRAIGSKPYLGNAMSTFLFANDNWKATRSLTINLGLRWEYNGIAKSMKEQALNSIADVPGVITFRAPRAQLKNFAPRLGLAYSPGNSGRTSIRGGFGLAYDQIFDNVGTNVRPPQVVTAYGITPSNVPGFFANGAIPASTPAPILDAATARALTTGYMPDQTLGYAINWNLGLQQNVGRDWVVDVRYVGTRGVHLLLQTQLNRIAPVTMTNSLPTYLTAPSQAELDALPLTLTQLNAQKALNNPFAPYGFTNSLSITSYMPQGASIYHGLAIDITKRFSNQFMFKSGYTWSHLMDNSTAEINTTTLTPRRPQDFNNLGPEWGTSALDRRQRLSLTGVWDTPWLRQNHNAFVRTVLANYSFSGTYIAESPEYVTPQSGIDANLNSDSVSDRVIVNPNGIPGVGSNTTALRNSANQIVAYVAVNPNAQFLTAQAGALANGGRNILASRGINNFDLSVSKTIPIHERYRAEVRADFYNAFNHSQFIPGRTDTIVSSGQTGTAQVQPNNPMFGQWDKVYPNNARTIQLVAKFNF
jgi:hypothetical protein